jgi:hypothetical protein
LVTAVAQTKARDIVLADGIYAPTRYLKLRAPHRLWGESLGGAVIEAGIDLGSNYNSPGAEIHCLTFDVSDPSRDIENSILRISGKFRLVKVQDSWFYGNGRIGWGITARQMDGLVLERLVLDGFLRDGIRVTAGSQSQVANPPVLIQDVEVSDVVSDPPGSSNGRWEAGIWMGVNGTIRRVRVRDAYWSGIWTGTNANDLLMTDVDIDGGKTGIYIEHYTRRATIQNLEIGPRTQWGIKSEWDAPQWGGRPAGYDNTVQDGLISAYRGGVMVGDGTVNMTIRRMDFENQCFAAIVDRASSTVVSDNDFSGIDSGAATVTSRHPNTSSCN